MKKLKKVFAVLLSVAMVFGMSSTVFAKTAPTEMPKAKVVVLNVPNKTGITVTAYQIVKYDLTTNNYKGLTYQNSEGQEVTVPSNLENLTANLNADEIQSVAAGIAGGSVTPYDTQSLSWATGVKAYENDGTAKENLEGYSAELDAGMWVVLVTGSNEKIYNPMVVSVRVDPDDYKGGIVDADGNFNGAGAVYAKSSTAEVTKEVEDVAYQHDETVKFTVTADVPEYSQAYTDVLYELTDTLSSNLEYVKNSVKVTVAGAEYEVTPTFSDPVGDKGESMKITIDSNTVLDKANQGADKVVVTYEAKLTANAKTSLQDAVTESRNDVVLEYSNNPFNRDEKNRDDDFTYQYTFGLDANAIGGSSMFVGEKTGEFIKVAGDGSIKYIEEEGTGTFVENNATALAGAVFELHVGSKDGPVFKDKDGNDAEFTTGEDGRVTIAGLDAYTINGKTLPDDKSKTYWLVEKTAPQGYQKVETGVEIKIAATIDETTKKLTGYTVSLKDDIGGDGCTFDYGFKEEEGTNKLTLKNDPNNPSNPYNFKNTKLGDLPSTGGIGTIIFTVGGCLIMVVAAALYFANRRRSANSESK